MHIFKTENLTYYYPNSKLPALDKINMQIYRNEMIFLAGASGCGKSTLLKLFAGLVPDFYGGSIGGKFFFESLEVTRNKENFAPKVGILFQNPEKQMISTDVESEIIFPLENMGMKSAQIKSRLAEIIFMIGIEELVGRKINTLSAGQKQKVALASVLAMNPDVLLLDEPTSQIDPISASELLNTVRKIARDSVKTVIVTEHKIERCLYFADRVLAMDSGKIIFDGGQQEYCRWALDNEFEFIPAVSKLFSGIDVHKIPVTVQDGRKILSDIVGQKICVNENIPKCESVTTFPTHDKAGKRQPEIRINNLHFSYDGSKEVLKNINLNIEKQDFVAILGKNGAGKTTLAQNINGLLKPTKGTIEVCGESIDGKSIVELARKIAYLGQNSEDYLFNDTVKEEILFTLKNFKRKWNERHDKLLLDLGLTEYENHNPRDLSCGQKQRVALASIMCLFPDILILDEPTRGMDYINKNALGDMLVNLNRQGTTIILITHDTDFAAEYCKRIVVMFNGEIIDDGPAKEVLNNSLYYSSQISKIFNGITDFITFSEAKSWIKNNDILFRGKIE